MTGSGVADATRGISGNRPGLERPGYIHTPLRGELRAVFGYIREEEAKKLDTVYDRILSQLVTMIVNPNQWTI